MSTPNELDPNDPVSKIVSAGREIVREDVEMLWDDFIEGRHTWQQTSRRALALVETVNVPNHIVHWGLLVLYYLWQPGSDRDPGSQREHRDHWRAQLREYDDDPAEWDYRHNRGMLVSHLERCGLLLAEEFAAKLVRDGLLRQRDADFVLDIARMPDGPLRGQRESAASPTAER